MVYIGGGQNDFNLSTAQICKALLKRRDINLNMSLEGVDRKCDTVEITGLFYD